MVMDGLYKQKDHQSVPAEGQHGGDLRKKGGIIRLEHAFRSEVEMNDLGPLVGDG